MTSDALHDPQGETDESADSGWVPGEGTHLVFLGILSLLACGYLISALQLPIWRSTGPGPGLFPVIVGAMTAFFAIGSLVSAAVRAKREPTASSGRPTAKVFALLASILAYCLLATLIGHLLTTVLVVAAMLRIVSRRAWWQIALIAVACALITDLVFSVWLGVRLPSGLFPIGVAAWI